MEGIYPLIGLSRPKSATLTGPKEDVFWVTIEMAPDRIEALWNFVKDDGFDGKYAKVRFDNYSDDGFPIDAVMTELILK